jgi:tetratricopeptide (TPR) repeat protein
MTARPGRDAWIRDNDRGLALATDGDWAEASEAFAAAADCLARILPSETRGVHEPLALVLSNLAQAYFRLGRVDEAMQQAQRACSLRVAIAGEDGMPVARTRMDMAVMLASVGRLDEATALVQRAIAGIEHRVGEEDARLSIVLENAARIALAAGQPANAEPLLLRLHALLGAHELSTSRAEQLLARVATVRATQAAVESAPSAQPVVLPHPTPEHATVIIADEDTMSSFDDDAMARVYAHASIAEQEEWEDQPLRDAVAVTDVLLRTTPSGVPVIPTAQALETPGLDSLAALSLDLADDGAESASPVAAPAPAAPFDSSTDFDLDLAFDVVAPLPPPAYDTAPKPDTDTPETAPPAAGLLLDFAVEHGMANGDETVLQGPPISSPIPDALDEVPSEPPAPTVVPVTQIVTSGSTAGISPIADIVQTAPPESGPVSPSATSPAGQRPVRRTAEDRVVLPKAEPAKGKGGIIALIAGVLAIGGGAAAFFLLR